MSVMYGIDLEPMPSGERIPPPFQGGAVVWTSTQGVALG